MQDFIWKRVNSKKFTQLNTLKYAKGTEAYAWNFYQLPHFSMCVMSQTPVHLVLQMSTRFQVTFFPLLARNTSCNPPDTTSTSKLQVFFRVKDHFYCSSVFLGHWTYVKLYYCVHEHLIFFQCVTNEAFSIVFLVPLFSYDLKLLLCGLVQCSNLQEHIYHTAEVLTIFV